jgi:PAS domain S-box-containing protein
MTGKKLSFSGSRVPLLSAWLVVVLAGCIILLGVIAIGAAHSLDILRQRTEWVSHSERVRYEIGSVLQDLTDMETGERGYVISTDDEFLEPYHRAESALGHDLELLKSLTLDNARQQSMLNALDNESRERAAQARQVIEQARSGDVAGARSAIAHGEGKQTMDNMRDLLSLMQSEESSLLDRRNLADAQARTVTTTLFWTLGALAIFLVALIAIVTSRDSARLHRSERELAATLRSVGDGIISTDAEGRVRFMNPIAERLTGWSQGDARGQPLDGIFRILNEYTRATVESPVAKVMREGTVVGLANHTLLIARDGTELPIEDSGAPVFGADGALAGVVLVFRDATAERQAQRLLSASEQRFRGAVDAVQGVLWTNTPEGQMRGEQPGWAALTGQTQEQYQGFGWAAAVHPEDAQPSVDAWMEAVRLKQPFHFEHRVRDSSGQWRAFAIRAVPLFDAGGAIQEWVGLHTDVTPQREIEQRLRERERRFSQMAQSIPQMVFIYNADGTPAFFNSQWQQYTGVVDFEAMRDVSARVIHPEDFQRSSSTWERTLTSGEPYEAELRIRRQDGVYRWFLVRANADRDDRGHIIDWFGTCTDVDASKKVEDDLRRTEASLREADLRKDVFLATLSHELRNPLAPIRTAARLLELPTLSAGDLERARSVITRQVRHMAMLLEDLLDVSRITRGNLTLKQELVMLQPRVADAIETAQPMIDGQRHVLEVHLPAQPVQLQADPVRLVQIIANLLTNAAKYTPAGGRITLRAQLEDGILMLSVRDSGIGIAPDNLSRVFEMFTRVSSAGDRTDAGLGIGLALVRGLVELHGGSVEAHSEGIGMGSEFRVRLPKAVALAREPDATPSPDPSQAPGSGAMRVLVADDNRDAAETLAMLLGFSGHEVTFCHDGIEAFNRIGASRPTVAILDIGMPGLNGYQVAQRVRAQPWGTQVCLIALTGWGQKEDQDAARQAGFDHHLTKPVDLPELEKLLAGFAQR